VSVYVFDQIEAGNLSGWDMLLRLHLAELSKSGGVSHMSRRCLTGRPGLGGYLFHGAVLLSTDQLYILKLCLFPYDIHGGTLSHTMTVTALAVALRSGGHHAGNMLARTYVGRAAARGCRNAPKKDREQTAHQGDYWESRCRGRG